MNNCLLHPYSYIYRHFHIEKADAKVYEPYMPTRNHSKSFKELQQINNDVIGWLKVNNTHINYPLVQCENDDKYMNTDVEGNYSLSN